MLALVALLSCAAGIAVAVLTEEPGDVSNPDVEFQAEERPAPRPPAQDARPSPATTSPGPPTA